MGGVEVTSEVPQFVFPRTRSGFGAWMLTEISLGCISPGPRPWEPYFCHTRVIQVIGPCWLGLDFAVFI